MRTLRAGGGANTRGRRRAHRSEARSTRRPTRGGPPAGYGVVADVQVLGVHTVHVRDAANRRALQLVVAGYELGHRVRSIEVTRDSQDVRRWFAKCSCGWESRTRPLRRSAISAYVWHLGVVTTAAGVDVREVEVPSGVSHMVEFYEAVERRQERQIGPASPGAA